MYRLLSLPLLVVVLAAGPAHGASPSLPGRLLYSSDRGPNVHNTEISAVSLDRSAARDLSRNQGFEGGASASPNGRWIAFWSERLDGDRVVRGLFVMRPDGSGQRRVTPPEVMADGQTPPTWSPDGRALAFSGWKDPQYGVWLVRLDGSGLRLLGEDATEPQWEPNGRRVAYAAQGASGSVVETVDVETMERNVIGPGMWPTWSPNARSVAFLRLDQPAGTIDLFVAPADGGPPVRLFGGAFITGPIWSPTGRSIAFDLAGAIYTIRPDGSQLKRLQFGGGSPSWSPSGAQIAYFAGRGVRVMRRDGTGVRQLECACIPGNVPGPDRPVWTHDGKRLIVPTRIDRSQYDLFVSNGDGSARRRLVHTKQDEILPTWSPDRRRIAFVRGLRAPSIWVSSNSGRQAKRLGTGTYPTWGSAGKRIAFERDGSVYTMSSRGRDVKLVTNGSMPAWSPDGEQIALFQNEALVVFDLRTHLFRKLKDLSCGDPGEGGSTVLQQPEWSPGSIEVAVTRLCDHGRWATGDAWLIDVDSGSSREFPPGAAAPSRLAWSPDGRRIAFTSESSFERIGATRLDGSDYRRISVSAGDDRDLDWR